MRALRFSLLCVLASALFCVTAAMAQSGAPEVRIVNQIDESQLVTLKGTVHPLANAKNDRGAAPDSTQLDRIHLVLKRSASQQAALDQLVSQLHTPGSASYHKWLTPDQFGKQFGPSDQDIATVETWLTGHGFNVIGVKPGKQVIEFSGNVGQFRSAFHTQIHKYEVNGQTHTANATDPQIPAALAPVVGGFVSLNNFRLKSYAEYGGKASYNTQNHTATPQWTYGTTQSEYYALAPADFAVQYDLTPLYTASVNGTGQSIAIINESNVNIDLVNQFRTLFKLPANPPQVIIDGNDPGVDGINNPDGPNGASGEAYLDVEWSGAVAPDATIDLVIAADTELQSGLVLAMEHAVYGNIAPVISLSFGGCERDQESFNSFMNALWEQAAAQGITAMVSAGDNGSASCDDQDAQYYAVAGQAVNGLASTPYNVAVGGTDFYYSDYANSSLLNTQLATYWDTTPSQLPAASIKQVIPEQPWNQSQFGLNAINYYAETGTTAIWAGSGGASNCATGSGSNGNGGWGTCTAGYAKPTWQTGTGTQSDTVRDLPDVSLYAAGGWATNYSFYPVCASDGDCQSPSGNNLVQISEYGGTSASSPAFAGIMALVNQKYGPQGQANYVLYPLKTQYPAAFHDVKNGTNSVPCNIDTTGSGQPESPDCISVSSSLAYVIDDPNYESAKEGQIGTGTTPEYNAAAGYNLATGLGTVDANVLVTDWSKITLAASTTTLTPSKTSFTHGTSITVSGAVTGKGTPSGSVALMTNSTEPGEQGQGFAGLLDGTSTGSTFVLSGGAFSGSTSTLPGGTYDIWGSYSGDGINALSTSTPVQITVNPESSNLSLIVEETSGGGTIPTGTTGITYGTLLTLDGETGPSSCATSCPATYTIPTGTVTFSDNNSAINTAVINSEGDAEYTLPTAFNAGSHSITAAYSGDGSYNPSTASASTFTVIQATPAVGIASTAFSGSYSKGSANTLSIGVEGFGNGNAPLGTVTLTGVPSGTPTSATLVAGVDPLIGTTIGQATVTIPATAPAGTYNITATYVPNTASAINYTSGAQGTLSLQITGASGVNTTTTASASASGTSPNALVTVNGTVTAASGGPPAGTVYFLFAADDGGSFEYVYSSEQVATLVAGTGNSSTFTMAFDSDTLPQGVNQIAVAYSPASGSSDNPSTAVVTISDPLADFTLIANTTIIPVISGSSASTNINVASENTFAGAVDLSCTVPSGWSCTIPASETLTAGGFQVGTLSVTAPKTATAGSYNVLITGKDAATGEYVHTLGLNAQVTSTAPGFALSNSGGVTVLPGATTGNTSNITVTPSNGFTGDVSLTCAVTTTPTSPTSPATCSVTPTVDITGTAALTGTLTVSTTAMTTPGAYAITVTGKNGTVSSTTAVSVTVSTPPSITLSNSGAISFQAGAATGDTATVTVTPSGGFTGNVTLACAVTPTAAVSPATCSAVTPVDITGTTAGTSTVTVSTTPTTTPGTYTATVTGTAAGGITSNTGVAVTVTALPAPGIALSNSGALTFVAGATTGDTATITVAPSNGFTGNVSLTCAVTTTPASPTSTPTCTVTPSVDITGTGSLTGTLTVSTTATTTPGAYAITVTGKDGTVSGTTTVNVTVNAPPSFALTNSGKISFQAGATSGNTATITVTPAGGFTGNVALTCAITPTASASPGTCAVTTPVDITGTTAGTSTLTITTSLKTTTGTYTATVTGTSGTITASTPVSVSVTAPPPPAITLSNSGALSFIAGVATGNTGTITVTPSYGFTGVVDLSCAVTPTAASSPATCSVGPMVDITGTGALTSTVTVTTTASTTPGSYTATVTGTAAAPGSATSSTAVNVTVLGVPSFTLTNNGPITFGVGASTGNTATVTVASVNNFASTVGLKCAVTTTPTAATSPATCSLASPTVPGGSGTDVLTVGTTSSTTTGNYAITVTGASGAITQTTVVNVTVNGSYTVVATSPSSIAPGASATSTVTIASTNGYSGSITVTSCTLTSSPSGASDPPSCSSGSQTVTLSSTTTSGTATVTVDTTAASTSELVRPQIGPGRVGSGKGWLGAGSGAVLALILFFGIPARRRSWRSMLGMVVLMVILGTMAGCGGGGGGGGSKNPGTTAGTYTFTVTATGTPAQSSGNTTTFTVTVN
ncbi:MAG: protease pro-enzyme activation domain-containing protein [Terracidiphilus sp.]